MAASEQLKHLDALDWKGEIVCPFCGTGDFDRIGLKAHLLNAWCEVFEETKRAALLTQKRG